MAAAEEKTTAATGTVIAIVTRTTVITVKVFRIFKKRAATATKATIEVRKEIATMAIRLFKRNGATSFNRREKYIWIDNNTACT